MGERKKKKEKKEKGGKGEKGGGVLPKVASPGPSSGREASSARGDQKWSKREEKEKRGRGKRSAGREFRNVAVRISLTTHTDYYGIGPSTLRLSA